ncbi:9e9e26af-1e51-49f3-a1c9-1ee2bba2fe37 [Sclerotinia trifoliorum]|uniref:9e9e26af-1e51-49f3-a1c9-1ee2bba2fe37 n=1 Tax=Sclerotinia trifoliorum TaxID=28548 RepID=A0A8H2ZLM8_9HELO|nr:9e9e26af-1e51-49f3-a1c9-1ee2bba2fe37 [Sclerotinia trifoliorum]
MLLKLALVCLGNLVTSICCIDITVNSILDAQIKVASSQLDKMNLLLNNNLTWFFDFTTQPHYTYTPGAVVNADAATFPASTNYGMTMALINLGPCGMLPPHYHPRGTNFVVAVEGVTQTWMVEENGAKIVNQTLRPWQMTIFPRGSIHSMQNIGTVRPRRLRLSMLNGIKVVPKLLLCRR